METALITGGSGGIGLAIAHVMAEAGHDLVLASRGKKHLEKAQKELVDAHGVKVHIIQSDLATADGAAKLFKDAKKHKIGILVNNAGMGYVEDFLKSDLDRNLTMMQLNMQSLVSLSHMFGNEFAKNGGGKIMNVASVASFIPGPNQPVYYATKAFVRSFSRALSQKLKDRGVSVTALHPGATKTDFFTAANAGFYKQGATAESVARDGYKAMLKGKSEVTSGLSNKFLTSVITRIVPYNLQARIVASMGDI